MDLAVVIIVNINICYYGLDNKKTVCITEIYCPALETPFRGLITPASCTDERANIRRDTVCTYGCVTGYNSAGGNQSVTCQIDGLWQGTVPYCKRKCYTR